VRAALQVVVEWVEAQSKEGMSGNSHSANPFGFLLIDIYIIYMMILIERWMPHRTEQFSIVMFDSKRLSLNLNP
jgi:hypothetical protein